MRAERPFGVTAAICTHNGLGRIAAALEHLSRQRVPVGVRWETLVVDNASSDGTAELVAEVWQRLGAPAPLRVSAEPTLGLSFARERSLRDANFEIITLIDDDNLVCEDWIATCAAVMRTYPAAGAVGGVAASPRTHGRLSGFRSSHTSMRSGTSDPRETMSPRTDLCSGEQVSLCEPQPGAICTNSAFVRCSRTEAESHSSLGAIPSSALR